MHDHWSPYFTFKENLHALCNQHLLRELKFFAEDRQESWAADLSHYLLPLKARVEQKGRLQESPFRSARQRFRALVLRGRQQRRSDKKRASLLHRLEAYDQCHLAFTWEPQVPFTNNLAEQDLRMMKLKQKISGAFRTLKGARRFARLRGYLSTCRKQGENLWSAMQKCLLGKPFIPKLSFDPG